MRVILTHDKLMKAQGVLVRRLPRPKDLTVFTRIKNGLTVRSYSAVYPGSLARSPYRSQCRNRRAFAAGAKLSEQVPRGATVEFLSSAQQNVGSSLPNVGMVKRRNRRSSITYIPGVNPTTRSTKPLNTPSESSFSSPPAKSGDEVSRQSQNVNIKLEKNELVVQRYQLGELLGCGRFGVVRNALDMHSGKLVAVKIMDKKKSPLVCKSEANIYTLICQKSGVNFAKEEEGDIEYRNHCEKARKRLTVPLNLCEDKDNFYVVMENIPGGDLFDRIIAKKYIPVEEFRFIFAGLLKSIQLLHANNIVHRDIKPENVLFRNGLGENDLSETTPVLTDFGLAYAMGSVDLVSKPAGTFGYASPEILTAAKPVQSFSKSIWSSDSMNDPACSSSSLTSEYRTMRFATDIWSLGVLAYASISGELPFPASMDGSTTVKEHLEQVYAGPRFDSRRWDSVPDELISLLGQMLHYSPVNRPTVDQLLEHPWVNQVNDESEQAVSSGL